MWGSQNWILDDNFSLKIAWYVLAGGFDKCFKQFVQGVLATLKTQSQCVELGLGNCTLRSSNGLTWQWRIAQSKVMFGSCAPALDRGLQRGPWRCLCQGPSVQTNRNCPSPVRRFWGKIYTYINHWGVILIVIGWCIFLPVWLVMVSNVINVYHSKGYTVSNG